MKVVVAWIERAVDGTAAGQHLRGSVSRLNTLADVDLVQVIADVSSEDGQESAIRKVFRISSLVLKSAASARPRRILFARHHPLLTPTILWWRLLGGRVVLSIQGSLDDPANEYPALGRLRTLRWVSRLGTRCANVLVAGAPVLLDHIEREMASPGTPVIPIPNGVFVTELGEARHSKPPMDTPYAVFVGNLATWQGIDVMVEARRSAAWPDDIPLVVVGDGVCRGLVENEVGVIWKGRLPASDAATWYAHAMCAISMKTSSGEVGAHGYWPFKLIESAAVGVPIVSSDARGMAEAANRFGNALVVRADDPDACAAAVARLVHEPSLREHLSERGLATAPEFDWVAGAPALHEALRMSEVKR